MILKRHIILSGCILVLVFAILITVFATQGQAQYHSIPKVIHTPTLYIEAQQVKQMNNVVTVVLTVENMGDSDIELNSSQILLSVEPYYQDHVHEATNIKVLDYTNGKVIPAHEIKQVVVEFDVNHNITTDYYFLFSSNGDFKYEQEYYSMILS
ncbi:MAG: hypothetical protein ACRDAO_04195 [Culicoidibacterales bacterium]